MLSSLSDSVCSVAVLKLLQEQHVGKEPPPTAAAAPGAADAASLCERGMGCVCGLHGSSGRSRGVYNNCAKHSSSATVLRHMPWLQQLLLASGQASTPYSAPISGAQHGLRESNITNWSLACSQQQPAPGHANSHGHAGLQQLQLPCAAGSMSMGLSLGGGSNPEHYSCWGEPAVVKQAQQRSSNGSMLHSTAAVPRGTSWRLASTGAVCAWCRTGEPTRLQVLSATATGSRGLLHSRIGTGQTAAAAATAGG
jgi:hypothetical protein